MLLILYGLLITALVTDLRGGRRFITITVAVCNDDWASKGTNLPELVARGFDLLLIQEGRAADYRAVTGRDGKRLLPRSLYRVHQDTRSPARAGSVVIWSVAVLRASGAGFTFGVKAPGIMARWLAWVRGTISGRRVFVGSAHWPPIRRRRWQPAFTLAIWARLRLALAAGRLIILGVDSNQHGGPPRLPPALVWASAVPDSIDGLIHSRTIEVISVAELPKDTSDHHPQVYTLRIPV